LRVWEEAERVRRAKNEKAKVFMSDTHPCSGFGEWHKKSLVKRQKN